MSKLPGVNASDRLPGVPVTDGTAEREPYVPIPSTPALTVRALMLKLAMFDPDARVYTEGCDCTGDAADVAYDGEGGVLITRR